MPRDIPDEQRRILLTGLGLPEHDEHGLENQVPEEVAELYWEFAKVTQNMGLTVTYEDCRMAIVLARVLGRVDVAEKEGERFSKYAKRVNLNYGTEIEVYFRKDWRAAKYRRLVGNGEIEYELDASPGTERTITDDKVRLPQAEPVEA